jgi:hypothetical protein
MSSGLVDELDEVEDDESLLDDWLDLRLESIESSAELNAVSSVEEILPDATSDCSSFWSN